MATAPSFVGKGEGRSIEAGGDLLTFKGVVEDGIGSLFMELVCPPGGGPPPHSDPSEELFYVLEGEFEFSHVAPEGETFRAGPGDSLVIPARAPHHYKNVGTTNARMIVFFRDNEDMQPFFEELGQPISDTATWVSSGPPSLEKAMAAAQRHGIEPVFLNGAMPG